MVDSAIENEVRQQLSQLFEREREMFISVDVEASGPIPGEYSMLSLGACPVFNQSETFYIEFKPISEKYDPEAIKVAGLSLQTLKKEGVDPEAGMQQFKNWLENVCKDARPILVAFNVSFDWMYVHYYFCRFLGRSPFGISGLDIKAYYMGKFGKKKWSETAKRRIDPKFIAAKHTHNALDDAIEQAEMFKRMFES
ncbi:3'-5' exonuclease [Candidatus Bathyarchaeota archaeon]|nr:3'-5' exonuclease [Candidatus Bathyarchaeota archaeon]